LALKRLLASCIVETWARVALAFTSWAMGSRGGIPREGSNRPSSGLFYRFMEEGHMSTSRKVKGLGDFRLKPLFYKNL